MLQPAGHALNFGPASDYVEIDGLSSFDFSTREWSVSMWIKPEYAADGVQGILTKRLDNVNNVSIPNFDHDFSILYDRSTRQVIFDFSSGGASNKSVSDAFGDDIWTHLVVMHRNDSVFICVNGIIEDKFYIPNSIKFNATAPVFVGSAPILSGSIRGNQSFTGSIDELQFWGGTLTEAQIQQLMYRSIDDAYIDASVSGLDSDSLIAYYRFDQGSPSGANSAVDTLASEEDIINGTNTFNGVLNAFTMSGNTSNWISSSAPIGVITKADQTFPSYHSVILEGTETGIWLGSDAIVERGVVYSLTSNFDPFFTSSSLMTYVSSTDPLGASDFTVNVNDLLAGQRYNYKAYIRTASGHYAFGQERSFTTGIEPSGNALYFDGVNDSLGVYLIDKQNTSEWSVDFWVKPASDISGSNNVIFQSYFNTATVLKLNYDVTSDEFDLTYYQGSAKTSSFTAGLTKGEWNHVLLSVSSSTITYSLNGVSQGVVIASFNPTRIARERLVIGTGYNTSTKSVENGFKGELDEFRLWNKDVSGDINKIRFVETSKAVLDTLSGVAVDHSDLYLYFNFNRGEAYQNNFGNGTLPEVKYLTDGSANGYDGKIAYFSLGNPGHGSYVNDTISNFTKSGLFKLTTLETILDIGLTSATLTGHVDGPWFENGMISRGVVVSEIDGFDPRKSAPADTTMFYSTTPFNEDTFAIQVNNLKINTRYFYMVFARSSEGVFTYANQEELLTSIDPPGYALSFDGVDDEIVTGVTRGDLGDDYTLFAWYRFDGNVTDTYSPIIGSINGTTSDFYFGKNSGNDQFRIRDGGSNWYTSPFTNAWDGNWHSVALVKEAGYVTLYLDGQAIDWRWNIATGTATNTIMVGRDRWTNRTFNGAIDEVRIWDEALTQNEILKTINQTIDEDYVTNNFTSVLYSNLLVYYRFDAGIPEGDNTTISQVQDFGPNGNPGVMSNFTLTGNTSNFIWSNAALGLKTLNADPLIENTAIVKAVITGIWTVSTPGSGGFCYSTTPGFAYRPASTTKISATLSNDTLSVQLNGLNFGETYYYRAFAINGNDTIWGEEKSLATVMDTPGNALDNTLTGTDDFMMINEGINVNNRSFTMELWAKKLTSTSDGYFFGQGINASSSGLHLGYADNNTLGFRFYGNDANVDVQRDDLWHHYAFVYESSTKTRRIYMDGKIVLSYTNANADHYLGTGLFLIGAGRQYDNEFEGTMDEVRIWDVAMSSADVNMLMSRSINPAWTDANLSSGTWSNLLAYYTFDQGVAGGDNTQEGYILDQSGNGRNGYMSYHDFIGTTSNLIDSKAPVGLEMVSLTADDNSADMTAQTTGIWYTGASPDKVGFFYSDKSGFNASSGTELASSLSGTEFSASASGLGRGETYYVKGFAIFGADTIWTKEEMTVTQFNPPGNNLKFEGDNDYVVTPFDPSLNLDTNFTVEAWVKGDNVNWTGSDGIVVKQNSYMLRTRGGTKNMYFYIYAGGGWRSTEFVAPYGFDIRVWHHYAGVYENDTIRIYMDGDLFNESTATQTIDSNYESSLSIGSWGTGSYFDGHIDEVRIWDRTLSLSDIQLIKNRTLTESWVDANMNSATWTNLKAYYRFDQGKAGGDNTAETTLFDFSDNQNHGSLMNMTLTGNNSNFVSSQAYLGVQTYEIIHIGFTEATMRGGLTGYWLDPVDTVGIVYSATQGFDPSTANGVDVFDEIASAIERSGDIFTIDVAGLLSGKKYFFRAFAKKDGKYVYGEERMFATSINPPGNALAFDGTDDYIRVYNDSTLSPETEITVEFWTKSATPTWSGYYSHIYKRNQYWIIPYNGSRRIDFRVYNQDGSYRNLRYDIPTGIDIQDWHHYSFTYDGQIMRTYIDGKQVASRVYTDIEAINIDNRYNLRIGRSYNGSNYYYQGRIDEVRIWHKALTADQIEYLKNRTINEELVNDMVGITWDELGLYYRFDQGIAGAENPGEYYVFDFSGKGNRGILYNFQLVGESSNWVRSNAALGVTTLTDFDFAGNGGDATFRGVTTDLWEGTFTERGIAYSTILNFAPAEGDPYATVPSSTPLSSDTFASDVPGLSSNEMIFYRGYATTGDGLYAYGESQVFVPGINPPGNALKFDGTDDRLNISHSGSIAPTEKLTVEYWAKSDGNKVWVDNGFLVKNYAYRIYTYQNSDRIQFLVWTSDGSYRYFTYDPPSTFDVGEWHHYAMTYDGYTLSAYVDGLLKMQTDFGSFLPIRDTHTEPLYLGYYSNGNYFDGEIDEFRIWTEALTQAEIQDMMNRTIDNAYVNASSRLSWDDLGLYYRFDQGIAGGDNTSIPIVYDYTGNKNFAAFENMTMNGANSNFVQSQAGIGVATFLATGVSFDQATLNGTLTGIFYDNIVSKGFVISDQEFDPYNPGAAVVFDRPVAGNLPGEFSFLEENLGYLTQYYYHAYYELDNGEFVYGNQQTFTTTLNPPGHALHFDRTDDRIDMLDLDIVGKDTITVDFWMNWEGQNGVMPMGFTNYSLYLSGGFFGFYTSSNDHYAMNNANDLIGKWVHVTAVFVRNNSMANKLYINGIRQELEQKITEPTARDFGVNFRIGTMFNTGGYDFEGTIDEFRFWNKELNQTQIEQVMDRTLDAEVVNNISGLSWDNLLAYYRFDQGTPNGDNTGISIVNDLSLYHIDGENQNFTLTGDRGNFIVSGAHIGVKTVPTVSDQLVDEVKLYGEITGIWNTNFVDSGFVYATTENFETNPSSATYVSADLDEGSGQFANVVTGLTQSTVHYFRAYVASEWDTPSGTVRDTVYGLEKEFYTSGVYPLDKYTDMSNNGITLFYRSVGTAITPGALTSGVKYSTSEGFDPTSTGTSVSGALFSGDTMNVAISGLTEGETYYYRPYVTDGSTTIYGDEKFFVTAMDAQGNAITFYPSGDHIAVDAGDQLVNNLNFTVSFWLNFTNTSARYVFEIPRYNSTAYGLTLLTNRNDQGGNEVGKIAALYITSSNSGEYLGSTRSDLNDGQWHEVVITLGDGGGKMYVDGVLEAFSEYKFDVNGFGTEPTYIGSYAATGNYYGALDEFRIWDKELNVLQMDLLRNRTLDEDYVNDHVSGLDWDNLKLYYRFDQGIAGGDNTGEDKIFDYSKYAWHGDVVNFDLTGTNSNWTASEAYLGVKTIDPGAIYTIGEATLEGNITGLIYSEPVDTGFEYSLTEGFTPGTGTSVLANVHENDTTFKRTITGLDPTQVHYFRAFANLANGRTNYGEEKFFIPGGVGTLDTVSNLDGASSEVYGLVTGDFTGLGIDTGIWFAPEAKFNAFAYPANKVSFGSGAQDTFMVDLTGLDAGTTYYFKAYVDIGGTFIFGEERSFKTLFNPPGNKLDFSRDGADDWISLNSLGNTLGTTSASGFSFEAWIKAETQTDRRTIFNLADSIGELDRIWFMTTSLNGERILQARINNTYFNSNVGIEDSVWHHVVMTVNPAATKTIVYVDGVVAMNIDDVPGTLAQTDILSLGANYNTNRGYNYTFEGQMDEVRFWNKPLTEYQISQLIYRTIDQQYVDTQLAGLSWTNLIGYFRMDQGLGGNANDSEFLLQDLSAYKQTGVLNYFNLDGSTSNWLISDAPIGVVTLDQANAYGANGGDFYGLISDRWYSAPLDSGIVYSDVSGFNPDTVVVNRLSSDITTSTDTFKVEIRDVLTDGQFYYYRAYVQENDSTWIYGREMAFYAGGIITLDTTSNITSNEARTMGEILANFPSAIDTGVVYYTVKGSDPDTLPALNFVTTLQTNVDTFVVDLSGLEPSTQYFYRAYVDLGAANGGRIYGAEYSFITFSTPPGRAINLNNTDDYLDINHDESISPTDELTYELWIKSNFPEWQTSYGSPVFVSKGNSFMMYAANNGTRITTYLWLENGARAINWTPPAGFRVNEWHHYCTTFDGQQLILYVDGDQVGTANAASPTTVTVDNFNLHLGHDSRYTNVNQNNARIQIDEFRLWKTVLSQNNIRQMMTRTLIEEYVENEVDGVDWSDLKAYYMFDDGFASSDNSALLIAEDASLNSNNAYYQNVELTGGESNYVASEAAAGVITDSLIYNPDSATTVFLGYLTGKWYTLPAQVGFQYSTSYDFTVAPVTVYGALKADSTFEATVTGLTPGETYYYRALTETGSAVGYGYRRTYVPLNFNPNGNALNFDGSNDYVLSSAANWTLDLSSKSFTVETWAKKQSADEYGYFMGLGTGTTSQGLHVGYGSSNSIRFNFWGNDVYTTIISDSLWHHFAFSYDASTYTRNIYMDGRLIRSYTNTGRDHFLGVGDLYVGRNINGTNFGGSLDEFRIWEKALNEAQINAMMNRTIDSAYVDSNVTDLIWDDLKVYYRFDQGDADLNNLGEFHLFDYANPRHEGYLYNFTLDGKTSNWVRNSAPLGVEIIKIAEINTTTASIQAQVTGRWYNDIVKRGVFVTTIDSLDFETVSDPLDTTRFWTDDDISEAIYTVDLYALEMGKQYKVVAIAISDNGDTAYSQSQIITTVMNPPGHAISLDGNNDQIVVAGDSIRLDNKSFTIETWARKRLPNDAGYFGWQGTTSTDNGLNFGYADWNTIRFNTYGRNIQVDITPDSLWHHFAFVYDMDNDNRKIYMDGEILLDYTNATWPAFQGTGDFIVGRYYNSSTFDGELDEYRIWTLALSQTEIREMMHRTIDEDYLSTEIPSLEWDSLKLYYRFDQGVANGANPGVNEVIDFSGNESNGILTNFTLTGDVSNWVKSLAPVGVYITSDADPVLAGEATMKAQVTGIWYSEIADSGFVYSSEQYFDARDAASVFESANLAADADTFRTRILGLEHSTTYYYKPYVITIENDTTYGDEREFTTFGISTLDSAQNITGTSMTLFGRAVNAMPVAIDTGIVYSTTRDFDPTAFSPDIVRQSGSLLNSTTTAFGSNISGLTPSTLYYYRAYITDGTDTLFGEQRLVRTLSNPSGNALHFDGTNDFVELPSNLMSASGLSSSSEITIEFWYKGNDLQQAVRIQEGAENYIIIGFNDPPLAVFSNSSGVSGAINISNNVTIEDNEWHHIGITWKQGQASGFRAYVDGEMVDDNSSTNMPLPNFTSSASISVGSYDGNGSYPFMDGSIDELRIWRKALSASQMENVTYRTIDQSYVDTEVAGLAWTDLVAYYRMDQGEPGGDNTSIDYLDDFTDNSFDGLLQSFTKTGLSGNFVDSEAFPGLHTIDDYNTPSSTDAEVWGVETGIWYSTVTARGAYYSETENFDTADVTTTKVYYTPPMNVDTFTTTLTGLTIGATYYFRAFLETDNGEVALGQERSLVGGGVQTLIEAEKIGGSSIIVYGDVLGDFTAALDSGAVFSTVDGFDPSDYPGNFISSNTSNVDTFAVQLTGLTVNTTYFYRAYIINSINDTIYGSQRSITTADNPAGNALHYDGLTDYIGVIERVATEISTAGEMTVELWMKPDDVGRLQTLLGFTSSNGAVNRIILSVGSNDQLSAIVGGSNYPAIGGGINVVDDMWHHVAVVSKKSSDSTWLYIDGELAGIADEWVGIEGTDILGIGVEFNFVSERIPVSFYAGMLDEVRIWDHALNEDELDLFLYRTLSEEFIDTIPGLSGDNLVAYYRFDQGIPGGDNTGLNQLYDFSGNAYHGQLQTFNLNGATSNWVKSEALTGVQTLDEADPLTNSLFGIKTGMWFNGYDSAGIVISEVEGFDPLTGAFTRDPLLLNDTIEVIPAGLTAGGTYYYRAYVSKGGASKFGKEMVFEASGVYTLNIFENIGGEEITLFGKVQGTIPNITAYGIKYSVNSDMSGASTTTVAGVPVDTFNVTVSGLSPETKYYFQALVNTSAPGTVYGDTLSFVTLANPAGNALALDGSGGHLSFDDNAVVNALYGATDGITFETWFNTNQVGTAQALWGVNNSTGLLSRFVIDITNDDKLAIYLDNTRYIIGNDVTDGEWHHIAVVSEKSPAETRVYLDGVEVFSRSEWVGVNPLDQLTIGGELNVSAVNEPFNGQLDEFRIWNKPLTPGQIDTVSQATLDAAYVNAQAGLSWTDLVAYYNFDFSDPDADNTWLTEVYDISGNNNGATLNGIDRTGSDDNFVASNLQIGLRPTGASNIDGFSADLSGEVIGSWYDVTNVIRGFAYSQIEDFDPFVPADIEGTVSASNGVGAFTANAAGLKDGTLYYYRPFAEYNGNRVYGVADTFTTVNTGLYYVDMDAVGANNGSSWADAYTELSDALASAGAEDTIFVAEGIYYPQYDATGDAAPTDTRDKTFLVRPGVLLAGGFNGTESDMSSRAGAAGATILSGDLGLAADAADNAYHVISVDGFSTDTVQLDGITITDGNADGDIYRGYGGGIYAPGHHIEITNATMRDNAATNGGAVYINSGNKGSLEITNTTFVNNTADKGAVIYAFGFPLMMEFDGINDYVQAENPNAASPRSYFTWYAEVSTTDTRTFASKDQAPAIISNSNGTMILFVDNGYLGYYDEIGGVTSVVSPVFIADGIVHKVAMVRESNIVRLYVDGVQAGSDITTGSSNESAANLLFGYGSTHYKGQIYGIRHYSLPLSQAQIQNIDAVASNLEASYTNTGVTGGAGGSWADQSVNGLHGVVFGTPDVIGTEDTTVILINNTLVNNTYSSEGIIYNEGSLITIENSILWNQTGELGGDEIVVRNSVLRGGSGDDAYDLANGIWPYDPLLDANGLSDNGGLVNTIKPLYGPVVNAGDGSIAPLLDANGNARIGEVDLGAVEYLGSGVSGASLDGTAAGAYLTAGSFGTINVRTIDFWIKSDIVEGGILNLSGNTIALNASNQIVLGGAALTGAGIYVDGVSGNELENGVWQHITVVPSANFNVSAIEIGRDGTTEVVAHLDELRLWNVALTATQMDSLMFVELTNDGTNLVDPVNRRTVLGGSLNWSNLTASFRFYDNDFIDIASGIDAAAQGGADVDAVIPYEHWMPTAASKAWEDAANWYFDVIPDISNTGYVVLNKGTNQVELHSTGDSNSSTEVYGILINKNASFEVMNGVLIIDGKVLKTPGQIRINTPGESQIKVYHKLKVWP